MPLNTANINNDLFILQNLIQWKDGFCSFKNIVWIIKAILSVDLCYIIFSKRIPIFYDLNHILMKYIEYNL